MNIIDVVKYMVVLAAAVALTYLFGLPGVIGAATLAHLLLEARATDAWWHLPS